MVPKPKQHGGIRFDYEKRNAFILLGIYLKTHRVIPVCAKIFRNNKTMLCMTTPDSLITTVGSFFL